MHSGIAYERDDPARSMNDEILEDGGMFISGDSFAQSMPWRLDDYGWGVHSPRNRSTIFP
jgi:hypothetical protein